MPLHYLILQIIVISLSQAAILEVDSGESIQAAIFIAQQGDTVLVNNGTYFEHISVNKPITLRGVGFPILDATASGNGITLKADGTILQGFRIRNSGSFPIGQEGAAIRVESNNNTITGNEVLNNFNGILVSRAVGNRIFNNIIRGNLGYGIKLLNANNNTIYGNIYMENYGVNAYDNGLNKWDNNARGNFYSDYDSSDEGCFDEDKDALCDFGHDIPGGPGVDRYPLARIIKS